MRSSPFRTLPIYLRLASYIWLQLFVGGCVEAQHLQVGVIGGVAVTPDYAASEFPTQTVTLPDGTSINYVGYFVRPGSRSLIGGPSLEWLFNDRFSVEADAIYRRLRLQENGPTVTWEFPILAKYRAPWSVGGVRPFVEAGPSLRTTGNRNTNPSHAGFTAGAGVDWRWRGFQLSPTLRYTRWAADPSSELVRSKPDQVEALFAVSRIAVDAHHPLGHRFRLGVAGGLTFLRPVGNTSFGNADIPGQFLSTIEYRRSWLVGPRIEVKLSKQLDLITEANYRQVLFQQTSTFDFVDQSGIGHQGVSSFDGKAAVLWQFPLLTRYRFGRASTQPFLDAGPSFCLPQEIGQKLSSYGVAAGAGVRFHRYGMGFESGLRFSYWGTSHYRNGETTPNIVRRSQLDAVFAIVF